ncbi:MAG: hypothetical protein ACLVAP_12325 [Parasutterella sp.]
MLLPMTLLRDSFGNEHRATPAIFALKEVPWIRIARTILSIFAANAQQSFPQGILSFLFFSIHLLRGFDLRNPFAAKFKTTPAPLYQKRTGNSIASTSYAAFFRCAL